ncbi:MAG: aldo/keto reductase [Neisseriaceae bacterium]|nr:aldo/keto reductase [Neisseriaceae bacterium]MBP6861185.1 aldo/keto reductase [Neisseriaceae bacterium]
MKHRTLGKNGPQVSALGLGCMGMSAFYGPRDDALSLNTLHHAIDAGISLFDTADMYGPYTNEALLGQAIKGKREQVFIATKFGIIIGDDPDQRGANGRPEYVRQSCEDSLKRLGLDVIDLYYQHRIDPNVPIEDTVGAMADLVSAGKVRFLGLSEASIATLERAVAVHPITALQTEYSLWAREPEQGLLAACERLDVGFVAYSPLGRGFLTGHIQQLAALSEDDFRLGNPKFSPAHFEHNLALVTQVQSMASDKGCTPAQLAIAWLLAQNEHIVPIPGTRNAARLQENIGALTLSLQQDELAALSSLFLPQNVLGERYTPDGMKLVNG